MTTTLTARPGVSDCREEEVFLHVGSGAKMASESIEQTKGTGLSSLYIPHYRDKRPKRMSTEEGKMGS